MSAADDERSPRAVSVVVPTIGRPTLLRAVRSALEQERTTVEVVVVDDSPAERAGERLAELDGEGDVTVVSTGGHAGAARARSMGTDVARHPWVAYVDDDDVWRPGKLSAQLDVALTHEGHVLVSCRSESVTPDLRRMVVPRQTYDGGDVATYLFRRRRLRADRNLLPTPTLLCRTELAREVGWRAGLQRHQDWDFVLRCTARPDVELVQLQDVLVEIHAGSRDSVSGSSAWSASLEWARTLGGSWPGETYVDFLVGQPLRYALSARSLEGVRAVLKECRGRGMPSAQACALGLSGVLTRPAAMNLMHR